MTSRSQSPEFNEVHSATREKKEEAATSTTSTNSSTTSIKNYVEWPLKPLPVPRPPSLPLQRSALRRAPWPRDFWSIKLKTIVELHPEIGFDRGLQCDEIVGVAEFEGEILFLMKWKHCDEYDLGKISPKQ